MGGGGSSAKSSTSQPQKYIDSVSFIPAAVFCTSSFFSFRIKAKRSQHFSSFRIMKEFSRIMQELDSRIVLLLMFLLDLAAFALTMAAVQTKTKATLHQSVDGTIYCVYSSNIASRFAVASMFLLSVSQTIVTVATQCLCFGKILRPGNWRISAIMLFITCWISFLVSEMFLFYGSVKDASLTNYRHSNNLPCFTLSSRVFGIAALLIVVTATASQTYYVSYVKTDGSNSLPSTTSNTSIGMGAY
ncbi:uncharacterized protein LOC124911720 [Impatiens glandulifera]|uniref:uncharacterized protein LOC124911720 n=1 Tax=Impatiens glandulifera TaxID=253017 RepID=UPI001FB0F577|nr:uncharacterized protein LOC124911720 [Impatiens glandulifera]